MSSRDFSFLTLRNVSAYNPDNSLVSANSLFVTSTNGSAVFSNNISISSINASTLNASTINVNTSGGINTTNTNATNIGNPNGLGSLKLYGYTRINTDSSEASTFIGNAVGSIVLNSPDMQIVSNGTISLEGNCNIEFDNSGTTLIKSNLIANKTTTLSSVVVSSLATQNVSSMTVTHHLITKAGSNDSLGIGGYMSQFTRLASSGSYTSDYQVTSDMTQFGNLWQDARYVYKDGDALGPPYLRQVWGIVTSTTASDLFPTSKLGDIRFFNTVKVDQLLMASTISSLNGLTNLGAGGAAGNGPPAGFFNLAFNPTTGQLGYYS